ncbi:hypothetical protein Bca4012_061020 [Brassica carinata]
MGGVGKTTLLTQINNKFSEERCGFDFVIWVVVSKDLQLDNIQDEVARKVGLGREEWRQKQKSQKTEEMYNFLRKKRFVLLLDDIWEKVDLTKIGIPIPTTNNQCKVAFTTRSQDVCARMGAENTMEVQCLSDDDAFDLFQKKVGKTTLGSDSEIPNLARIVAKKCHGLPLALDVIGETMSCKRTIQEWRHAIDILTSYAIEFFGMEDKILPLLKFSYDSLKGEKVKACLLYCALLPEDYEILKETLIDYWICEGIIDASEGSTERAENKGYEIIGSLVRASLLMDRHGTKSVCMHDVVREMALWIASDLGKEKEAFIVRAGVGLTEMPKVKNWEVVKRMSLCENGIYLLPGSPKCPELKTFLLKSAGVRSISSGFFEYMQKLVVLDLSHNGDLSELPNGISKLVSLQYLNLSWTGIRALRMDLLEGVKNLNHLDLRETHELWSIAGISRLHNLKILKLSYSYFSWDRYTVEELETLKHLDILTMGFRPPQGFEHFLRSHKLMSCTRSIEFWDSRGLTNSRQSFEISLPVAMDKLRDFSIRECRVHEIKMEAAMTFSSLHSPRRSPRFLNLSHVDITSCNCLRELTLLMFAPNIKSFHVSDSRELEDIINKEKACKGDQSGIVPFPKLVSLKLNNLPKLKNVYWNPLPLPYLHKIHVSECPNLKKLPLDSQSGKHGEDELIIRYTEQEWIDGVEWEDEATKTRFLSSCKKV